MNSNGVDSVDVISVLSREIVVKSLLPNRREVGVIVVDGKTEDLQIYVTLEFDNSHTVEDFLDQVIFFTFYLFLLLSML